MSDAARSQTQRRLGTLFGWIAGGTLGLLFNYAVFLVVGESYPTGPTTFALFALGAFGGMTAADRLGARAFRVLGVTAGILVALTVTLAITVLMFHAPQ